MGTRRTLRLEFKQRAVEASDQPGASIAGVAMAHGINTNQLHKWRRQLLATKVVVAQPQMLPCLCYGV
jgi:transposase